MTGGETKYNKETELSYLNQFSLGTVLPALVERSGARIHESITFNQEVDFAENY